MFKLATKASKLKAPIAGWLHRVAVTGAIDMLRQRRARIEREAKAAGDAARGAPKELSWEEIRPQVDEAVAALPERLRVPIVLYYLEHRKQEEIAAELGISQPAVSGRLKRGVEEMRKRFQRLGLVGSAVVIGTVLYANSAEAAPATVVATVGKMALAGAGRLYTPVSTGGGLGAAPKVIGLAAGLLLCLAAVGALVWAGVGALKPGPQQAHVVMADPTASPAEVPPSSPPAGTPASPETDGSQAALVPQSPDLLLNEDGAGTNMFLDLDTGRLSTIPGDVAELETMVAWMRRSGADVLHSKAIQPRCLIGADLSVVRTAVALDAVTAETLRNARFPAAQGRFPVILEPDRSGRGTFLFATREGAVGVLEILAFDDPEPGSAHIRYRILSAGSP
jgi:RNA polymerase sigma factor (sigma-70 family)